LKNFNSTLPFECKRARHATSLNPSEKQQTTYYLRTNNKDCSKGEGLTGNEDLHEMSRTAEGVAEGLPEVINSIEVFRPVRGEQTCGTWKDKTLSEDVTVS